MGWKSGKFYRDATKILQTRPPPTPPPTQTPPPPPPPPPPLFLRQKNIMTGAKFHSERNVKTSKIVPSEALSPVNTRLKDYLCPTTRV